MINLEIDGKPVQVAPGTMVIQAANQIGITVPHFCYHKKLSIAANCRMCLVQVEKAPKPLNTLNTMISAALPTAMAVILIHAITLIALVDLFDRKYRQANRKFKGVHRRQLPYVPGASGKSTETIACLRDAGSRRYEGPHPFRLRGESAEGRDGIFADQSSARLPDLRSGRRMPVARSIGGLWRQQFAL